MEIGEPQGDIVPATVSSEEFDKVADLVIDDYRTARPFIDSAGKRWWVLSFSVQTRRDGKRMLHVDLRSGTGLGQGEIVEA